MRFFFYFEGGLSRRGTRAGARRRQAGRDSKQQTKNQPLAPPRISDTPNNSHNRSFPTLFENLLDASHIPFTHHKIMGTATRDKATPLGDVATVRPAGPDGALSRGSLWGALIGA